MRPQKVDDIKLLEGLMSVLRNKGYDGASLNDLASASGLQKASLYHRYPGGKKDIALAVLDFVGEWMGRNIVEVLSNESALPSERLELALKNITLIYDSGQSSCIMRALSMDSGLELFAEELKEGMDKWLNSFTKLGVDFGLDEKEAQAQAMRVLVQIQGSLVVSKALQTTEPFEKTIEEVELMYTKG